jgi:transposase
VKTQRREVHLTYRKYPLEFRQEAVALVRSPERSIADVARSLGISNRTPWYWVREAKQEEARLSEPGSLSGADLSELNRLRKENAQQKIDMEILRKAAAYFAKETMR